MASDPDGLWPRRADVASDGLDENRAIDDIELTLEEDAPVIDEEDPEWMADADQRAVEQGDEDDGWEADEPGEPESRD